MFVASAHFYGQITPEQTPQDNNPVYAQNETGTYILKDIVVDGVKKYTPAQILRFTGLNKNESVEIPGQKISNAIKKLWETQSFSEVEDYSSTSAAAKLVSENPQERWAAIANSYAAKLYGLKVIHKNIQDFEQNHTKFIIISKKRTSLNLNFPKSSEKTSLLVTLPEDHAGGLHQVLSVFAWRKMNLSKIESRTMKKNLGNYFFFINVASEWHPVLSENALEELRLFGADVKFIGHYNEYILED